MATAAAAAAAATSAAPAPATQDTAAPSSGSAVLASAFSDDEVVLDRALVEQLTGVTDMTLVERLEIVLQPVHVLSAPYYCTMLKEISCIRSSTTRVGDLSRLGQTLRRVCITECGLTEIPQLGFLPHLVELLLHGNKITRIQNLVGMPNLQKLWLQSNRIARIEGLDNVPRLRELWLQDNAIRELSGLAHLSGLQVLALAGNPLQDMSQLQALKPLTELFDLSFQDDFFAPCPVVAYEGYQSYMLTQFPSLAILDGRIVADTERTELQDAYMVALSKFNHRIETIKQQHEEQLREVEERRARARAQAAETQKGIVEAIEALERLLVEGQQKIREEVENHLRIFDDSTAQFDAVLDALVHEHKQEIDAAIEREESRIQKEQQATAQLTAARMAAAADAVRLQHIGFATRGAAVAAWLDPQSPEYKFAEGLFAEAAAPKPPTIVSIHHIHNATLQRKMQTHVGALPQTPRTERLLFAGSVDVLHRVIAEGFNFVLAADPMNPIVKFYRTLKAALADGSTEAVLLCSVCMGRTKVFPRDAPRERLASLLDDASCGYVEEQDKRLSFHFIADPFLAVPEFYIRFDSQIAPPSAAEELERLQQRVGELDSVSQSRLSLLEGQVYEELWLHNRRVIGDLEGGDLNTAQEQVSSARDLQETITSLRDQLAAEQALQDAQLRQLRLGQALPSPSARKSGARSKR